MKKRIENKMHIFLYVSIVLILVTGCSQTKEAADNHSDAEEEFIEYLITEDTFKYDSAILDEWKNPQRQKELLEKNSEHDAKSNFILGSLYFSDDDIENAAKYLENAAEEADSTEVKMKSRAYYELCKCYIYTERYDDAEKCIEKMIHLFDNTEDKDYLITLNLWLSYDVLEMPEGTEKAVTIMEDTLEIGRETEYESMEDILATLARCYCYHGEVVKAMNCQIEALDIAKTNKNTDMIVRISTDIGMNYLMVQNGNEAIAYLNDAYDGIKTYKKMTQEMLSMGAYITDGLFRAYLLNSDSEQAWNYITESKEYIEKESDGKTKEDDLTRYYSSLARYYITQSDYKKAAECLDIAQERYGFDNSFNYVSFDIELYISYGDLYLGEKDYNKALEYYKKVEELFETRLDTVPDDMCLEGLYKVYKEMGDMENACHYAELRYDSLEQSYISQENQHASFMLEKFRNEQNEKQIETLQTKNKKLVYMIVLIGIVVINFMIVSIIIYKKSIKIEQLNKKLKEIGERDELTGLFNRRAMNEYFQNNWDSIINQEHSVSLIMMDVDYFKKYNDYYGHQKGDYVLAEIGRVILEEVRECDYPVRYGGEEFLIILPATSLQDAVTIAKRIKDAIAKLKIEHEKSTVSDYITVSLGVSHADNEEVKECVLKRADQALYEAKKTRDIIVAKPVSCEESII